MGGMNLFGNMGNKNMPSSFQGMPKNMNVNKRKISRKQKQLDKKQLDKNNK